MSRPKQDGLLYFSFDTDFFYADKRIKRLHAKFGNDGLIFFIYLLTEIYRNGYYTSWSEEVAEDIADDLHFKEGFTEQVMKYLVSRSLLTMSTLANSVTIITSPGIQRRYQEAKRGLKRQTEVDEEIWLLSESETLSCIKVTKNPNNSEKNPSFSEKNESNSEKNHTKENKGKEIKEKEREWSPQTESRFNEFCQLYPKRVNALLAVNGEYTYLLQTTPSLSEDDLIEAVKNYAEACRILKTQERYIKNPENWLKDSTWINYLPENYKKPDGEKKQNKFNQFPQNDYDFEELERKLLSN